MTPQNLKAAELIAAMVRQAGVKGAAGEAP